MSNKFHKGLTPIDIHTSLVQPKEVQQNQPLTYNGIKFTNRQTPAAQFISPLGSGDIYVKHETGEG